MDHTVNVPCTCYEEIERMVNEGGRSHEYMLPDVKNLKLNRSTIKGVDNHVGND
ncbi:hypothetical protein [Alteribacillus iranensis]|uniref:Uncharacterized protein n=1 Tax=Alteribacillus iranensis TaxID=930128 RepID=A0A1I2E6Y6_9BACI|nr:hypothetical protein [Alteribacillus iranensis]SFE88251.1 hypothetical protein SAMN05192532_105124 [Alteribacillus iranensis]